MTIQVYLVCALFMSSFAIAQKIQIPSAVLQAFAKQYPDAKQVKWEMEDENYEAEFKKNKTDHAVLLNVAGIVLQTEVEIPASQLPAIAAQYLVKTYPGQKVKEATKISKGDRKTTYEAEIKNADILFDAKVNFIMVKQEANENNDKD